MKNDLYKKRYKYWLDNSPLKVKNKLEKFSENEIYESFHKDIEFGTAGIRALMGLGSAKFNEFVISQYAYAFGKTLLKFYGNDVKKYGIIIFHDNRKNSSYFTLEAAKVISGLEIPVFLSKNNELKPTPYLSYLITNYNFVGGINITASHNPKEYNGFKLYDRTGKQAGDDIIEECKKNLPQNFFNIKKDEENIVELSTKYDDKYINDLIKKVPLVKEKDRHSLVVTYGTNHGTALKFGKQILRKLNVNYKIIKEQSFPSETFENVSHPNPQDHESFDLSKKYGEKYNAELLFLTDPDADRFGVVVRHKNKWVHLNGNETAVLQIAYKLDMLSRIKYYNFSNKFIVRSIVTSYMADSIAKKYGVKVYESYTGFKSIFSKVEERQKNHEEMIFAWEESNGFTTEPFVKDKDSFQALYQFVEMAYEYKLKNKTLIDVLEELYEEYGFHYMEQIYKKFDLVTGLKKMNSIIDQYRKIKAGDKFLGHKIVNIIDYSEGYKQFKKQNVLFLYFENNSWICLRPSGTEPLLRIYLDLKGDTRKNIISWFEEIKHYFNKKI